MKVNKLRAHFHIWVNYYFQTYTCVCPYLTQRLTLEKKENMECLKENG